jgi:hypothetical protein
LSSQLTAVGPGVEKMKYTDGNDVQIGDRVIADESEGVVVTVLDTKQFSDDYPEGWTDEKTGVFIETKRWGLIHYLAPDDDVKLIEREKA